MDNISSSNMFSFDVRGGYDTMPLRLYIMTLCSLITGGLGLAAFLGSLTYGMTPNLFWIIGYFAIALPGIFISVKSDNWFFSLIGYLMVILATGLIIGPYVALYELNSVLQVVLITIGASAGIGFAGAIWPKSVEHWGGFLLMGLFIIIFGDIAQAFMIHFGVQPVAMGIWDWIAAALFCAFIFYDMNRAVRLPYTMDNAVDSAVALYLDIINLFVRLLAIMGKSRD